ncbi:tRNA (adenosine(37)-N6)-threonylcarbamoyltransferase complex ATPase subunit type 1 TsaE [Marinicella litoralis]|uniref:tRNA threonylcarbamoyladenosine biosynthesis protein TsaE n=1 Tax=Marinicella litoralis TaxID=644220 RepID=A0A4R6XWE3_9GAMM|nr:tRNA (adenosine(37)-N6)-threonylcarbamoyltransferase complex ATPase subunit type 1 TsaE [Marinicella litoralis]TDR22760.1 tRNA threonylcarbamoyladenosine biosynthesis protein TsaE [Marinicella litoralis]
MQKNVNTLSQLKQVAEELSRRISPGELLYLKGDLGAGKTTFTQYFLKACGVKAHVKSPTYTLYETYQVKDQKYVHMDLYRLTDPEELYFLGIEDLINGHHIILVEWPSKGQGVLPEADWILDFQLNHLNRTLTITLKQ